MMNNKLSGWDDTIVALATPAGVGAIAVIRISGKESMRIIDEIFPSKKISEQPSHTLHVGILRDKEGPIDEVVVSVYRNPKSFTGEDSIEISCHGSPYIQQQIIQACIRHGARAARAGEFTQRAFLNGKMDLTQAEAVADLIASNTEASKKTALNNIRGGFSSQLKGMREQLIQFASLIELELDFAAEDVEFADRGKFFALIDQLQLTTQQLIASFKLGNVIKHGVSVAIIGKPNAGKSTLLNKLLNEERAIVSEIAGTTRDTIEETINIHGILFRLIDTAGIRSHSSDVIENIGIEKSLEKMKTADVVLYIFDVSTEDAEAINSQVSVFEKSGIRYLLIGNKADQGKMKTTNTDIIEISAKQNTGIDQLKDALYAKAVSAASMGDQTIITNARHLEALEQMQQSLADVRKGLDEQTPGDLLALDIRRALYFLGEITGEITNEDKLDYIFSKFCIGK
ncbi:MAG: tRNA uridine-5-carboxymethylaminomethyl(34) synthesis GTPase MnmE [Ferruginibacter sp.]